MGSWRGERGEILRVGLVAGVVYAIDKESVDISVSGNRAGSEERSDDGGEENRLHLENLPVFPAARRRWLNLQTRALELFL